MQILSSNNSFQNSVINPNFKAIPLAKYQYLQDTGKDLFVYKLEKRDVNYLKFLKNNIAKFFEKHDVSNESARQVIQEAIEAGIKILQDKKEKHAKILMSFYDDTPSSILIGNTLKTDKKGKIHYSSRKNHAKDETELDWLATWNKKIPGEGMATVYEYFCTVLKDNFKHIFVRSELPEKSSAKRFYERMGFDALSEKPRMILRENDNQYKIGEYDDLEDMIIPMKATKMDIIKTLDDKKEDVLRKEIKQKTSVNFELVI